jgi:ribonuclease HI
MIEAWFDGVCEPKNPGGHAAYGALVKVNGVDVMREGAYVGFGSKMSNNVAEYSGMIAILAKIIPLLQDHRDIAWIRGDSMLVVNQLRGTWEVHGGLYIPYFRKAWEMFDPWRGRITLEWIPREKNGECDELSKGVLRERGVRFRIQPEKPDSHLGAVEVS